MLAAPVRLERALHTGSTLRASAWCRIWMLPHSVCAHRCLLLEDSETGDILMPLFYMRAIFEANYSRKLASLKHRRVTAPRGSDLAAAQPAGCAPYWQWAFESPQHVKAIVRQELGEKLMPQARRPGLRMPRHALGQPACVCHSPAPFACSYHFLALLH